MPSRERPKTELVLTEEERTTLTQWAQRATQLRQERIDAAGAMIKT
jgi:hypothetical protein